MDRLRRSTNPERLVEDTRSSTEDTGDLFEDDPFEITSREDGVRNSVVLLESSKQRKAFAITLYIVSTLLFTICTSLSFFKHYGTVPSSPSSTEFATAVRDYQSHINELEDFIANEIDTVYADSIKFQEDDCLRLNTFARNEQDRLKIDGQSYASTYCQRFIPRLYTQLENLGFYNESDNDHLPSCPYENPNPEMIHWIATIPGDMCPDFHDDKTRCIFAYELQKNPNTEGCNSSSQYEFDHWWNLRVDEFNSVKCSRYESRMQDIADSFDESKAVTEEQYLASLQARLDYDIQYLKSMFSAMALTDRLSLDAWRSIRYLDLIAIPSYENKFSAQMSYLSSIYGAWKTINSVIPGEFKGLQFVDTDIEVTPPSWPNAHIDAFELSLDAVEVDFNLLDYYNPPKIVGYDVNVSDYYISDISYAYTPPNITFAESALVQEVSDTIADIIRYATRFEQLDVLFRACVWLRRIATVFHLDRRDFSSIKSKTKRAFGAMLSQSVLILVAGTGLYVSANVLGLLRLDFSGIPTELLISCNNSVILNNQETLVSYQQELFVDRSECDFSIETQNNKSRQVYTDLVLEMYKHQDFYESFYQSNDDVSFEWEQGTVMLVNFSLPEDHPLVQVDADFQQISEIELYEIDASHCASNTTLEVTAKVETLYSDIETYGSSILVLIVVLNLCSRLFASGLKLLMYMDLTHGYSFDAPFSADELRKRIRTKRRQGMLYMFLVICGLSYLILFGG